MDNIFLLKLILSFVIGGTWITIATILAEKFGTKIGGAIAGIPSTMVVALLFIGLTQSPIVASQSTTIIPIIIGIDSLFVLVYILLCRFNFYLSVLSSIILWFVLSFGLVLIKFNSLIYSLLSFAVLSAFSYLIIEKKLNIKSESRKKIKYSFSMLLFRAIFSGAIVLFSVLMAKISGPALGGIFAVFPAMMLSTIVITHFAHGKNFSLAVMKSLMASGSVNPVVYAISIRYSYIYFGLMYGTLISFFISLISSYIVYIFVNKKMS